MNELHQNQIMNETHQNQIMNEIHKNQTMNEAHRNQDNERNTKKSTLRPLPANHSRCGELLLFMPATQIWFTSTKA